MIEEPFKMIFPGDSIVLKDPITEITVVQNLTELQAKLSECKEQLDEAVPLFVLYRDGKMAPFISWSINMLDNCLYLHIFSSEQI